MKPRHFNQASLNMGDIDFYNMKPGEVCNHQGDICGMSTSGQVITISKGEVAVTAEQASDAARFGWVMVREQLGLCVIRRSNLER